MEADRRERKRVAREAAALLYTSQEKEYKQAKIRAAETCGTRVLPSNLEVAEELDRIAEEREGKARQERLVQMRKEAVQLMKTLESFHPLLVGSVWRGTTHRNSDVDIVTFHSNPEAILRMLKKNGFNVTHTDRCSVTKEGKKKTSFHIYITLPSNNQVEIVVRSREDKGRLGKCEVYGDEVTGLSYQQLRRILKENPTKRFVLR
ncbi:MAG: nucleotidyltransferase domain-containing protein [Thermoproteota archaeon]|nr:nucleotidyltransferase domain-containing protein [Thermoproteota archaeon]